MLLIQLGRARDADDVVTEALQLNPGSAPAYDGLAYASLLLNRPERASALYRRATELDPDVPQYWYSLARSERSLGRLAEAEAACDRCIALDPLQYPTYLLRSELRVQDTNANHLEELRLRLTVNGAEPGARAFLGYALAKELDDLGRFDEAFDWFVTAARARRSLLDYDVARDEEKLRRIAAAFARVSEPPPRRTLGERARSIFIFGLPRSGTTLVERILGGLDQVESNGETDNFSRALNAAAHGEGDMFARAAAADPSSVAEHYARYAGLRGRGGWVIEKQPTNYLYLGAIRPALPDATLLLVTRTPIDVCFAMFRTLFGAAFPFSYDFTELARYYAAYRMLIGHWRTVLGDALHEVAYEHLVREPVAVGESMARNCGLTWTDQAIAVEKNPAVSLTASASQVRRPIYGTSSGRWRHYRRQLAPLLEALRKCGVALPDDPEITGP